MNLFKQSFYITSRLDFLVTHVTKERQKRAHQMVKIESAIRNSVKI